MSFELTIILGLCLVLAVILGAYNKLVREFKTYRRTQDQINEEAREKAARMVDTARDRAIEIMAEAKQDSIRESDQIDRQLQEISTNKMNEYKLMLQNISKSVETTATRELSEFKKTLSLETYEGQKIVGEKISEAMDEAKRAIEEYKAGKITQVDGQVAEIVKKITLDVLGRGLRVEDQTKLVIAALSKAKHDGLFD